MRLRWLIIYNALVDPREATEIAAHTGATVSMVHQVISSYNRLGISAVETPSKGGRRRQYLSLEEERAFLAPFFDQPAAPMTSAPGPPPPPLTAAKTSRETF